MWAILAKLYTYCDMQACEMDNQASKFVKLIFIDHVKIVAVVSRWPVCIPVFKLQSK